jgi:hypothetical protein
MRIAEHPLSRLPTDADQKATAAANRAAHGAFHHEAKTSHQLLFNHIAATG